MVRPLHGAPGFRQAGIRLGVYGVRGEGVMSVRLMAEIFETEFRDLQDAEGNTTKASTAKFVCIALADHANDEGEGAYPSLAKLAHKTSLSRTCVINTMDALKYNGIASVAGTSKWDTVNYTINRGCFSQIEGSKSRLLVNPVDSPQSTQLTPPVNPVDPIHPLTVLKPSLALPPANLYEMPIDWQMAANAETIVIPDQFTAKVKDAANLLDMGCKGGGALAEAFMIARRLLIPDSKIKGNRKAARDMLEMGVRPEHVAQAVESLSQSGMTITDLFSISKTAIDLANKAAAAPKSKSFGL